MNPAYVYRAELVRVVDGDTLVLRVALGFRVFTDQSIRLHGVDCPELRTAEGKTARQWVIDRLTGHESVVIQSYKGAMSFARWVADVWLDDGSSLAADIIAAGQGVEFMA